MTQGLYGAVQEDKNFPADLQASQQRDFPESLNLPFCPRKEVVGQKVGVAPTTEIKVIATSLGNTSSMSLCWCRLGGTGWRSF